MAPSRLLTVADHLGAVGGSEIAQLRIVEGLASAGWAVELLYVSRGDLWPQWNACVSASRVVRGSGIEQGAPLRSILGTLERSKRMIQGREPDLFYVHNPGDLPAALAASGVKRVPVALHLHLPPPSRQPAWLNHLIRRARAVITPSSDTALRWRRVAGLSSGKVSVIPTGVRTDRFAPVTDPAREAQRCSLGIDSGVPMILFAGRLDRTKGLHHLLEACRRMEHRAALVVCGDGGDKQYLAGLRGAAETLDVTWLERRSDVATLLASADLLVLPSLVPETQGMVVIEAMACGTPAVASAVGGLTETLRAFPNHLVPPGDVVALAEALDRLVGWRLHSPTLGAEVRRWVADHLAMDRTVAAVSALLTEVKR